MKSFYLHQISDSTGETVQSLSRACLALFPNFTVMERLHPLIYNEVRMEKIFPLLEEEPGIVVFSLANQTLSIKLQDFCKEKEFPHYSILKGPLSALAGYLGCEPIENPGAQHTMDDSYFKRIEAIHYTVAHDDGNGMDTLDRADVILLGVSRTSKTPTCFQLANRGLRAANIPFVPEVTPLQELSDIARKKDGPIMFGLTCDCEHLLNLRRNRMHLLGDKGTTNYTDPESVRKEILLANKFFQNLNILRIINVTHRSIEETASAIFRDVDNKRQEKSLLPPS